MTSRSTELRIFFSSAIQFYIFCRDSNTQNVRLLVKIQVKNSKKEAPGKHQHPKALLSVSSIIFDRQMIQNWSEKWLKIASKSYPTPFLFPSRSASISLRISNAEKIQKLLAKSRETPVKCVIKIRDYESLPRFLHLFPANHYPKAAKLVGQNFALWEWREKKISWGRECPYKIYSISIPRSAHKPGHDF